MTTNRKLEIVAGIGGVAVGLATAGVLPAAAGAIGAAVSTVAMLFREKPEKQATKIRKAKETLLRAAVGGQAVDAETPRPPVKMNKGGIP
jgi:hypothetical protein